MNLYLRKPIKKRTCLEFLIEYFSQKCPSTFSKKNCTRKSLQCPKNRSRSFSDLNVLCKTYFPSLSINKIYYYIVCLIIEKKKNIIKDRKGNIIKIGSYHCPDVKKYVIHHSKNNRRYDALTSYFNSSFKNENDFIRLDEITYIFLYNNYLKYKK